MSLQGTFAGIVEDNRDPEKLGRLKVRVPHVYGAISSVFGAVSTESIPWALPAGLPNGLSPLSGGCDWLPERGDQVLVRFLDGEPEKPVWEWFMQTQAAAKTFKLHQYAASGTGDAGVGAPQRGAWTRYGHTLEWNKSGLIMTTSKGYRLVLIDAGDTPDGDVFLGTQGGQYLEFDDSVNTVTLNANEDFHINVGDRLLALCDAITLKTMSQEIELISGDYFSFVSSTDTMGAVGRDWLMSVTGKTTHQLTGDYTLNLSGSWLANALKSVNLNATTLFGINCVGPLNLTGVPVTVTSPQLITLACPALALSNPSGVSITSLGKLDYRHAGSLSVFSETDMTLKSASILLSAGLLQLQGATHPYVFGDTLYQFLTQLLLWCATHTHPTVGPPVQPVTPLPTEASLLSTDVFAD